MLYASLLYVILPPLKSHSQQNGAQEIGPLNNSSAIHPRYSNLIGI